MCSDTIIRKLISLSSFRILVFHWQLLAWSSSRLPGNLHLNEGSDVGGAGGESRTPAGGCREDMRTHTGFVHGEIYIYIYTKVL